MNRYGTWHRPSRVSFFRYAASSCRIVPRGRIVKNPRFFERADHVPIEEYDQFEQPIGPIYQDKYYSSIEPEYIYEDY